MLALAGLAALVGGGGLLVAGARERRRIAEVALALGAAAWLVGVVMA